MTSSSTAEAEQAARAGALRYVHDDEPGIRRVGTKKRFAYVDARGRSVRDAKTIARIRALAIPPAWTGVWICASSEGHVQATGRDARGRKQYRYHTRWRSVRDEAKFELLFAFGHALPGLRRRIAHDLARPTLDRAKVVATIIAIMERTSVRVGNDCYAQENHSFGLTTFCDRHARVSRSSVTFDFVGKSGKSHHVSVRDARLAAIVKRCRDIPGQRLFQFVDEAGVRHPVTSCDVNAYLRDATEGPFTAKMVRTWIATVTAAKLLFEAEPCESARAGKRVVQRCLESVAAQLGNTPAISRKSYIHPALFEHYATGELHPAMRRAIENARPTHRMSQHELAVLAYFEHDGTAATLAA